MCVSDRELFFSLFQNLYNGAGCWHYSRKNDDDVCVWVCVCVWSKYNGEALWSSHMGANSITSSVHAHTPTFSIQIKAFGLKRCV